MLCEELEKIKNHQKNIKKFNSYLKKKYRQKLIFSFFKLVFYFYNLSIKLIYKSKWIAKKLFIFFNKLIKKCKRKIINFFVLANYRRKKKRKFLIYINSIDDTEKKPKFYFIISNLKLFLFKYELKFFEENKHVSFKYLYYFIKVFCHNFFNYTMRFTLYFRFKNFCKFCSFLLYRNKVICYLIGKFKKKLKNNPLKLIRLSIVYNLNNKFFKRKKFDLTRLRRRFKRGNKNV